MGSLGGGNFSALQRHFLSLLEVLGRTGGFHGGQAVFFLTVVVDSGRHLSGLFEGLAVQGSQSHASRLCGCGVAS